MIAALSRLPSGTQFRLHGMPEVRGVLVSVSDCSALVRVLGGVREIVFEDRPGHTRRFIAQTGREQTWAPATIVEVLCEAEL